MSRTNVPVIEVSGLRIERDATIIHRIDWRVEAGQHWVILGANGSGKTSLLSALAGYLPPTAGEISVLGKSFGRADWRLLRARIGMVSSAVHQMMPPAEKALNAVISGRRAMIGMWGEREGGEREQALEILHQIEAQALAERPWIYLSQGERQRVLIGRALMARPELLILDEPCAGLDPVAREHFVQFLGRLAARTDGPTLVLVTHHVEEIMPRFSHVLVLKAGRALASGEKASVLNSAVLSEAFGAGVKVAHRDGRYSLTVAARSEAIL